MIRARSSESSFTMVLTVEYKIGLRHPEIPKRYHAKNLDGVDVRLFVGHKRGTREPTSMQ